MLTVDQIYELGIVESMLAMAENAVERDSHEWALALLREARERLSSVLDGEGED